MALRTAPRSTATHPGHRPTPSHFQCANARPEPWEGANETALQQGGKPVKARRRKAATLKRRNAPKAVRRRIRPLALQEQLARVTRERDEALEQQAAISDILRVISNSPSDVQPVLNS